MLCFFLFSSLSGLCRCFPIICFSLWSFPAPLSRFSIFRFFVIFLIWMESWKQNIKPNVKPSVMLAWNVDKCRLQFILWLGFYWYYDSPCVKQYSVYCFHIPTVLYSLFFFLFIFVINSFIYLFNVYRWGKGVEMLSKITIKIKMPSLLVFISVKSK